MATTKIEDIGFKILKFMPKFVTAPIIKFGNVLRRSRLKLLKTPINLTLYITNRCNAKCKHCFYAGQLNKKGHELTLEEIGKVAKSLRHPLRTLMITGGEPFLRDDVAEICRIFVQFNKTKRITIDTNGMLSEKIFEAVKQILKENRHIKFHVQVSLDGAEEVHNKMRGVKEGYDNAIQTIKGLEELQGSFKNLEISVLTTICDINFDGMVKFAEQFAKEHPNVLHKFNIMRGARLGTFGLSKDETSELEPKISLTKTPEQLTALFDKIKSVCAENHDEIWQALQHIKWEYMVNMLKNKKKIVDCTARYGFAVVYPNGDVSVCEPIKPFANLKDFDFNFYKLWNSDKAGKAKKIAETCFCIHPCNLLDSMAYDTKTIIKAISSIKQAKCRQEKY